MKTFNNKIILITGAAAGIGRCLAQKLAEKGANLILSDMKTDQLDKLVLDIGRNDDTVTAHRLDVTDEPAFEKIVNDVIEKHGRLDYIFNNAGIAIAGEVRDIGLHEWKKVLDVNLIGVIHGSIHAYKAMVRQGFGHIVNMGSLEGLIPFPYTVPYVASKYAVVGLSNGLRVEGSSLGVDVSVVCPGFIRTGILASPLANLNKEELMKSLPLRFAISPEQCADRILKGVAKNKAIITVTGLTKVLWWIARISPALLIWLVSKQHARTVKDIRLPKA